MTGLQRGVKNVCEHWRQLISAVQVDGETESGPAALLGFCLLKSLLTSLSCMERVVSEVGGWEEGWAFKVGIGRGAQAAAEVGEVEVI